MSKESLFEQLTSSVSPSMLAIVSGAILALLLIVTVAGRLFFSSKQQANKDKKSTTKKQQNDTTLVNKKKNAKSKKTVVAVPSSSSPTTQSEESNDEKATLVTPSKKVWFSLINRFKYRCYLFSRHQQVKKYLLMVKTIRLMFQQLELKHQRLNNKHLHARKMSKDKMGIIKRNNQNLVQSLQRLILQFNLINNKRQEKVGYDLMRSKLGMHRGRQYY